MAPAPWPAQLLLGGVALVLAVTAIGLVSHPAALNTPGAMLLPPAVLVLSGIYSAVGLAAVRRPAPGDGVGAIVGLAAGALWCIEIYAGGPARLDRPTEVAVGATFSLLAVAVTLAAGPIAVLRGGPPLAALRFAAFAGLYSGVLVFVFSVVMTLASLDVLASRDDYQAQLARSQAPDMSAFLVQDILAAACAHLVINPALALAGAGLASLAWLSTHRAVSRGRWL